MRVLLLLLNLYEGVVLHIDVEFHIISIIKVGVLGGSSVLMLLLT